MPVRISDAEFDEFTAIAVLLDESNRLYREATHRLILLGMNTRDRKTREVCTALVDRDTEHFPQHVLTESDVRPKTHWAGPEADEDRRYPDGLTGYPGE